MRIFGHQETDRGFGREYGGNKIDHRIFASDQVFPKEMTPRLAHGGVCIEAPLAVNMSDHIVAAIGYTIRKCREKRADITASIGYDHNVDGSSMFVENSF